MMTAGGCLRRSIVSTHQPESHDSIPRTYTGHQVIDEHGTPVGSVVDVVFDMEGVRPEYMVVDPGVFRSAHYVPVAGSYFTEDDQIVVPWNKAWIKGAAKATGDHVLTTVDRRVLEDYYTSN
jgi:sporulation protein YlmC with PRC-barrel domain